MSRSANITGPRKWWHFDAISVISHTTKMFLITKFEGISAASQWFCVPNKKLAGQLSPGTWLN